MFCCLASFTHVDELSFYRVVGVCMEYGRPWLLGLAILVVCSVVNSECLAQRSSRYEPSSPTVSPYLNLLRRDSGGVPNYYSFIRPQQRQQTANSRQQIVNQQIGRALERQQDELLQFGDQMQSQIAPTGAGSVFLNFSHYYLPGRRERRR